MNILEGVRPAKTMNSTKFIIKSKPSLKDTKPAQPQLQVIAASDQDVQQFMNYMISKSKRYRQLLQSKSITDQIAFSNTHLFGNPCIRALVKAKLDNLLTERRIGKNLKGINRDLLQQIQNSIWISLEREVALYQLQHMYQKQKTDLENEVNKRKSEIERQMERLAGEGIQQQLILKPQ